MEKRSFLYGHFRDLIYEFPDAGLAPKPETSALQDYQMQLMLLEQQNKKRLMVARMETTEQDIASTKAQ